MTALQDIPVSRLHPSPLNPRRDVGDIDELADSLRNVGLLQPLVVRPNSDGYEIVAGHRRLAAARKAGLDTLPCVVHADMDDIAFLSAALIENCQRADLTPLEEAAAYKAIVDLGVKQRDLAARINRKQPHISRRLSLLKLPDAARALVDTGGIKIEDAVNLAKLPADTAAALFAGPNPPPDYEIHNAIRRHDEAQQLARLRAQLEKAGVTVLDEAPGPAHSHRLATEQNPYGLNVDADAHAAEPCHAATVQLHYTGPRAVLHYTGPRAVLWCTDPDRHAADGDSPLKELERDDEDDEDQGEVAAARVIDPQAQAQAMRRQAVQAAAERRAEFCRQLARCPDPTKGSELLLYAAEMWLETFDMPPAREACALLGIDVTADARWDDTYLEALRAHGRPAANVDRPRARHQVLTAIALATGENLLAETWGGRIGEEFRRPARVHLAWLEENGYQPSDLEHDLVADDDEDQDVDVRRCRVCKCTDLDACEGGCEWVDNDLCSECVDTIDNSRPAPDLAPDGQADSAPGGGRTHLPQEPAGVDTPTAEQLEQLGVSLAVQDGVRAMKAELDTEGPIAHDTTVAKSGRRWKVTCTCGHVGHNTTQAYAEEAAALHAQEAAR